MLKIVYLCIINLCRKDSDATAFSKSADSFVNNCQEMLPNICETPSYLYQSKTRTDNLR